MTSLSGWMTASVPSKSQVAFQRTSAAIVDGRARARRKLEDPTLTEDERQEAAADVQGAIDRFLAETGWRPKRVKAVAGALLNSKFNFLVRFVMERFAKKASIPAETSRDYEFKDWKALDRFVDLILGDHIAHALRLDQSATASNHRPRHHLDG